MATHDYVIDNSTGANVRSDINSVLQAILTNNSSSSAPSTTAAYMWWADTTNGVLKIRNSANDGWVELLQLDGTLTLEDGSASTPALAFRDDLNTGIFSAGADIVSISAGGVERAKFGSSIAVINDDGVDVDFRIEGSSIQNLFYVDAGNDRIGINQSTPQSILHIAHSSGNCVLELQRNDSNTTGGIGTINFTASDGHSVGSIGMIGDGNNEGGDIVFRTTSDAANADPFNAATPERMRLTSLGRLGVGTVSPQSIFHVKLSTNKHIIFSDSQGEVGNVPCIVPINDSHTLEDLGFRANHLNFAAGTGGQSSAQKMTIDDTGVAIGAGDIDAAGLLHIDCGTDKNIVYSGGIGEIGNLAGFQCVNDAQSGNTGFGIRASEIRFAITSAEKVRIDSDGLKFNGDTAAANALNDYEEGTVTITLNSHSDNTNVSVSGNTTLDTTGHYIKIGDFVHVSATFTGLNASGGNNRQNHVLFSCSGLPFATFGGTGASTQTTALGYNRGLYARYSTSRIDDDLSNFYYYMGAGGTIAFMQTNQVDNNGTLFLALNNTDTGQFLTMQVSYRAN